MYRKETLARIENATNMGIVRPERIVLLPNRFRLSTGTLAILGDELDGKT
jgi:hypothetical protein